MLRFFTAAPGQVGCNTSRALGGVTQSIASVAARAAVVGGQSLLPGLSMTSRSASSNADNESVAYIIEFLKDNSEDLEIRKLRDYLFLATKLDGFSITLEMFAQVHEQLMCTKDDVDESLAMRLEEAFEEGNKKTNLEFSNAKESERIRHTAMMFAQSLKLGDLKVYQPNNGRGDITFSTHGDMTGNSGQRVVPVEYVEKVRPIFALCSNKAYRIATAALRAHRNAIEQ